MTPVRDRAQRRWQMVTATLVIGVALLLAVRIVRIRADHIRWKERQRLAAEWSRRNVDPAKTADLDLVRANLRTPESAWAFITAPETHYADRVAATRAAHQVLTAPWQPVILEVTFSLTAEAQLHQFGFREYPLSSMARAEDYRTPRRAVGDAIHRSILGHTWTVPDEWTDYPITPDELERAPWPWQVFMVLSRDGRELWAPRQRQVLDQERPALHPTATSTTGATEKGLDDLRPEYDLTQCTRYDRSGATTL